MNVKTISLTAALAFSAAAAFGFGRTDQGTWAAGGEFNFDPASSLGTVIDAELTVGQYLRQGFMVGGFGGILDNDYWTVWSLGATVKWHFLDDGTSPFSPFLGADLGVAKYETFADDATALFVGGYIGFDFFLTENAAVETKLNARFATDDIYSDDDGPTSSDITVKIGLMFFF